MEIPKEVIAQIAGEVLKELEEGSKATGKKITFDDLEGSIFRIRQKMGEDLLQKTVDTLGTGKLKKKTVQKAMKNSDTKGVKKRK